MNKRAHIFFSFQLITMHRFLRSVRHRTTVECSKIIMNYLIERELCSIDCTGFMSKVQRKVHRLSLRTYAT